MPGAGVLSLSPPQADRAPAPKIDSIDKAMVFLKSERRAGLAATISSSIWPGTVTSPWASREAERAASVK
ncbi:hypothetical protein D3C71_1828070 [compost metagenome]